MSPAVTNLKQLQALLYRLIVAPNGVAEALADNGDAADIETIIVGDARMTAVERAGIYADAYFYRLRDSLKEDFPATFAVVGEDEFHNLITGYLIAYPPAERSLFYAGRHLADYLDRSSILGRWPFIADLARLERTLIESFHAADALALDRAAIQAIPPQEWPAIIFVLHPATRILKLQWQVDEIVRTAEQNAQAPKVAAAPVTMIVWRRAAQAIYRRAEPAEAIALDLIEQGCDFSAICQDIGTAAADDDVPQLINRLLVRWLDDGVLLNQTTA